MLAPTTTDAADNTGYLGGGIPLTEGKYLDTLSRIDGPQAAKAVRVVELGAAKSGTDAQAEFGVGLNDLDFASCIIHVAKRA